MAYKKGTIRRMTPEARKLAKMVNELDSVQRRLKNYVEVVRELELWAKSAQNRAKAETER